MPSSSCSTNSSPPPAATRPCGRAPGGGRAASPPAPGDVASRPGALAPRRRTRRSRSRRSSRVCAGLAQLALGGDLFLGRGAVAAALAQGPQRRLALMALGAIEDQDPVEVVDLVLEDARLEAGRLEHDGGSLYIPAAEARVERPLDVHRHPRQA